MQLEIPGCLGYGQKKLVYTITFYLQFLCVAGYLKRSNDATKLNIHKYTNYNIIVIYINRLSATTQTSIVMDYLILMSEKNLHFGKMIFSESSPIYMGYSRTRTGHFVNIR